MPVPCKNVPGSLCFNDGVTPLPSAQPGAVQELNGEMYRAGGTDGNGYPVWTKVTDPGTPTAGASPVAVGSPTATPAATVSPPATTTTPAGPGKAGLRGLGDHMMSGPVNIGANTIPGQNSLSPNPPPMPVPAGPGSTVTGGPAAPAAPAGSAWSQALRAAMANGEPLGNHAMRKLMAENIPGMPMPPAPTPPPGAASGNMMPIPPGFPNQPPFGGQVPAGFPTGFPMTSRDMSVPMQMPPQAAPQMPAMPPMPNPGMPQMPPMPNPVVPGGPNGGNAPMKTMGWTGMPPYADPNSPTFRPFKDLPNLPKLPGR